MKILVIEDEPGLSDALCQTLRRENWSAEARYDGESGLDEALTGIYDAIILDVMLPRRDGFSVLRELRREKLGTPVLMLTARAELDSRVEGLDAGADYYLTKPFEMRELLACLRAITRRPEDTADAELQAGDLVLRTHQGGIYCAATGKFVKMSVKELHLLELLMKNQGRILEKEQLFERVWGLESDSEYNNIEVYISFLRKKLNFVGSAVRIKATRGIGYSLEAEA
ncbi:MAG: response regulator transcription factor [Clostridia bacterium]|nr:response regulator transcription factor [Clostridia bacterium]